MDWTDFDDDDHTTLVVSLVTSHGRATPLAWKTVEKSKLAGRRTALEHEMIERLQEWLPKEIAVLLLADRGFGDQKMYALLELLGWDYVIRFRGNIVVETADGKAAPAAEFVGTGGRARSAPLRSAGCPWRCRPAALLVGASQSDGAMAPDVHLRALVHLPTILIGRSRMRPTTMASGHLRIATPAPDAPAPRLGLTRFDRLAIDAFVAGESDSLVEHVRDLAEALSGPERGAVRLRTISRSLACERSHVQLLEKLLGDALGRRDHEAVVLIDRALRGASTRMTALLEQHRAESSASLRNVVLVSADTVNVRGGS